MPNSRCPLPNRSRPCPDIPDPELYALAGTRHFNAETFGLFLACSRLITLGLAHALSKWWERGDPVQAGFAERMLVQTELEKYRAILEITQARLARFPARQRKHYTPEERFQIITLMQTYGLTQAETARNFLVDAQTVSHWESEAMAEPEKKTVGTLVRARPPLRGYDDVVKRLVLLLDSLKVGGSKKIAQMLARAGIDPPFSPMFGVRGMRCRAQLGFSRFERQVVVSTTSRRAN